MAQNRFASVPNISIPRSRFKQPFNHSTSFMHGQFVPIDCFDILPGDTYKLDLSSLIWMSTPERPVFGNIWAHVSVYFVPMRLVWDYTKEFFGENKTSSGYQTTQYKIPSLPLGDSDTYIAYNSLSHYLGKPIVGANSISAANRINVSVLKERAYYEVWNNYVRAEQLQNPVLVKKDGNYVYSNHGQAIGTLNGSTLYLSSPLLNVNKDFDYFTAATLAPQYGPAVALPLGSYAPVVTRQDSIDYTRQPNGDFGLRWWSNGQSGIGTNPFNDNENYDYLVGSNNNHGTGYIGLQQEADGENLIPANLWTDLSQATAATINQLRYAFAVQKFLERSNFGSRFFEMLEVHYGITSPDGTLQIPQRLGHADFPINISTVLATTSGTDGSNSNDLGQAGAASCTANKSYMFTHSFTEPGFLFVMLSTTHERSYTQGILREDMKADRYEIYSPEFANLGDQEILNAEIYYANDAYNKFVFGYQEHWAEYRYRMNRVSGMLDPQAPNSLAKWNLAEDYSVRPALDASWIVEDRAELARALYITDGSVPDYIGDFFFDYVATREMPLFTIPGLIDHFGVR